MYLRFVHCDTFDVKRNSQWISSNEQFDHGGGVKQFVIYKLDFVVIMIWPVYTILKWGYKEFIHYALSHLASSEGPDEHS